ncbi:MAG: CBS domain-containing protein [Actinobacteria bacterium]|nr:CBS domain-containing protein [Actinomycetota bacterium]
MSKDLVAVSPSASVAEAATVMGERRVSSTLVMDGDDMLGIFTERDIVRALAQHHDASGHQVSEWMTADPTSVPHDMAIQDALQVMLDGGYRHLPIKDGGKVVGVVSMRDISRWLGSA